MLDPCEAATRVHDQRAVWANTSRQYSYKVGLNDVHVFVLRVCVCVYRLGPVGRRIKQPSSPSVPLLTKTSLRLEWQQRKIN